MEERIWPESTKVIVVGVENGAVTPNGSGVQRFDCLADAKVVFPDLDASKHSARFTGAMGLPTDGTMRFETWAAFDLYSR